jgi:hypothetical protein
MRRLIIPSFIAFGLENYFSKSQNRSTEQKLVSFKVK